LAEVDADDAHPIENRRVLGGHGLDPQHLADLVDGLDHRVIQAIIGDIADEVAIDLEVMDGQGLDIAKGR
jgi:hypothetical protein